jgi:uncharacterized protein (TIGR00255 family)
MSLQSMTGFARSAALHDGTAIAWELRSVNGKGLELRLRVPPGMERLEQPARAAAQQRFSRGNIQASLSLSGSGNAVRPVVNEALLEDLARTARGLEERFGVAPANAAGLLAIRGVLDYPDAETDDDARGARDAAILSALDAALDSLAEARRSEGAALTGLLLGHVAAVEALVARAEADPSREPAAIRARLAEQVRLLMETGQPFDEARLAQEAAFLATKADIREEIDRLRTHVDAARALLASEGPVGRKLDFLAQEFNRESNTLCSKSNAATITSIGLELKAVVDQFREQVQNLE